jgi:trehalose-6-phosphate synthase
MQAEVDRHRSPSFKLILRELQSIHNRLMHHPKLRGKTVLVEHAASEVQMAIDQLQRAEQSRVVAMVAESSTGKSWWTNIVHLYLTLVDW